MGLFDRFKKSNKNEKKVVLDDVEIEEEEEGKKVIK